MGQEVFIKDKWPGKRLDELTTTELLELSQAQRTGDREGVLKIIGRLIENEGQKILQPVALKKGIQQLDK